MKKTFNFNLGIDEDNEDVDDIDLDDKIKIDEPKRQAPAPSAPAQKPETLVINTAEEKPEAPKLSSA